jgi:hypothetical protein
MRAAVIRETMLVADEPELAHLRFLDGGLRNSARSDAHGEHDRIVRRAHGVGPESFKNK